MPEYSYTYKKLHDIEWFFRCREWAIHAVSNGGYIPRKIDRIQNTQIQYDVEELKDVIDTSEGLYINRDYVNYRLGLQNSRRDSAFEDYIRGFVRMARKGFCSFDRDITLGENARRYVLIAAPLRYVEQQLDLPELVCGEDVYFWEDYIVLNERLFSNWYFE